jgi:hypothetical protein
MIRVAFSLVCNLGWKREIVAIREREVRGC